MTERLSFFRATAEASATGGRRASSVKVRLATLLLAILLPLQGTATLRPTNGGEHPVAMTSVRSLLVKQLKLRSWLDEIGRSLS